MGKRRVAQVRGTRCKGCLRPCQVDRRRHCYVPGSRTALFPKRTGQGATPHTQLFLAALCPQQRVSHKGDRLLGRCTARCPEERTPRPETAWITGRQQPSRRRNGRTGARDGRAEVISVVLVSMATEETVCSFIARTLGALPPLRKEPQLHWGVQPLSQHAHFEGKSYCCASLPLATAWLA